MDGESLPKVTGRQVVPSAPQHTAPGDSKCDGLQRYLGQVVQTDASISTEQAVQTATNEHESKRNNVRSVVPSSNAPTSTSDDNQCAQTSEIRNAATSVSKHEIASIVVPTDIRIKRRNDTGEQRPRPTNENENFVRDYFASSRLHFIGSFRARYEAMMGQVAERLNVDPAALLFPPPMSGSTLTGRGARVIVHVDMDCFFASVAIALDPSLSGKPIAVCHARPAGAGSGEISSCSYEARAHGVKAGMFFSAGKQLCPELIGIPYDFNAYERASISIYANFFAVPGARVEALSVDEAFLDLTHVPGNVDDIVRDLRTQIAKDTRCTASAGIGSNKLIARLATKRAKPDGQLRISVEDAQPFIAALSVRDLHGVGWRTAKRFTELGIETCAELRDMSLSSLQNEFGERQGRIFYDTVRGVDDRPVEPMRPRKSIGAEVSWGVRFDSSAEDHHKCLKFIDDMAAEVADRVVAAGAVGTKILYKAYRMKDGKPHKYLGHGPCDILSKSAKISDIVTKENLTGLMMGVCQKIHRQLGVPNNELRGVGIQLTELIFENLRLPLEYRAEDGATSKIDSFLKRSPGRNLFNSQLPTVSKRSLYVTGSSPKRPRRLFFPPKKAKSDEAVGASGGDGGCEIPKDWDPSVFMALPEDIRKELLGNHRHSTIRRQRSGKRPHSVGGSTPKAKQRSPNDGQMTITQFKMKSNENIKETEDKPSTKSEPPEEREQGNYADGFNVNVINIESEDEEIADFLRS